MGIELTAVLKASKIGPLDLIAEDQCSILAKMSGLIDFAIIGHPHLVSVYVLNKLKTTVLEDIPRMNSKQILDGTCLLIFLIR